MKNSKFLWSLLALPALAACSNDLPEMDDYKGVGRDGVYMAVNLTPSRGTRSETNGPDSSSDGVEVGTDAENAINGALILIADPDNGFIGSAYVNASGEAADGKITQSISAGNPFYQSIAKFDKTALATYYDNHKGDPNVGNVNVFVYCNPPASLVAMINGTSEEDGMNVGSTDWVNLEWVYNEANESTNSIWGASPNRGFTMTNSLLAERQLPSNITEWNKYDSETNAFNLSGVNQPGTEDAVDNLTNRGAVTVERMAARFDFRDGSQMVDSEGKPMGNGVKGQPFTYGVVKNTKGEVIVNCELQRIALTNMCNSEYYLGRVSDNGRMTTDSNWALCGAEMPWFDGTGGNYVVSSYAQAKYDLIKTDFATYFQYPFFSQMGTVSSKGADWDWYDVSTVMGGNKDNYKDQDYRVWRYVTENTIPAPADKQVNAQSTGVVFKTRMLPTDKLNDSGSDKWERMLYQSLTYDTGSVGNEVSLNNNPDTDPILYSLAGNTLYVTWENVRAAALSEAGFNEETGDLTNLDRHAPLYVLVFGENGGFGSEKLANGTVIVDNLAQNPNSPDYYWHLWENARKSDPTHAQTATQTARKNFKAAATGAGFALYQSSQDEAGHWGYYCYYYYWNRHNDNMENSVMGPMEFAVVRNNVYKLALTKLLTLGHPRIPENDPNDPKPDTPDETSTVYLTVNVEVLPWVVRINNIEF